MAVLWVFCDRESSNVSARPAVHLRTAGVTYPGERYGPGKNDVKKLRAEVEWLTTKRDFRDWAAGV